MHMTPLDIQQSFSVIMRGVSELISQDELVEKLSQNRKLRIKAGFDPTAPDLHLGHTVLLNKLRQFQDLGHHVLLVIGDFTGAIGDPTGKNITRPTLDISTVRENAETYTQQAYKILDAKQTEVVFNSTWLERLGADGVIKLAASSTVARMLERNDFSQRFAQHLPISIHEFLYPLLQGYDSVALRADIEIGGTDQKFNLLMGRELQKQAGQNQQCVLMMPLLEGLDGVHKMSKSLDNAIGISEPAPDIFAKIMSLSDELMWRYIELLSSSSASTIADWQKEVMDGGNPRDIKVRFAREIVTRFYDESSAELAHQDFYQRTHGGVPEEIPHISISISDETIGIAQLLKQAGLVDSHAEAFRKLQQDGVKLDGKKITDRNLSIEKGSCVVAQVGKRKFAMVSVI